jgi:WD40 repeat protein
VKQVEFLPSGRGLFSIDSAFRQTARIWDVRSGKCLVSITPCNAGAVSPNGQRIAVDGYSTPNGTRVNGEQIASPRRNASEIYVFDIRKLDKPDLQFSLSGYGPLAFSPTSDAIAYLSGRGKDITLVIWNLTSNKLSESLPGKTSGAYAMRYSSDGRFLAVGGHDHRVRLLDVAEGKQTLSFEEDPYWLAFSPDGRFLVGQKAVWDLRSGKPVTHFPADVLVQSAVVLPDGIHLIAGCRDSTIRVWDLKTGRQLKSVPGHTAAVSAVAISHDSKQLASGSMDSVILLWDLSRFAP